MPRYSVKAYLCTNFAGLMASLDTNLWNEVEDFIWENVQRGYNCELTDNVLETTKWAYADDFDEEALNPEDLLRETQQNDLLADLRLEQTEQM